MRMRNDFRDFSCTKNLGGPRSWAVMVLTCARCGLKFFLGLGEQRWLEQRSVNVRSCLPSPLPQCLANRIACFFLTLLGVFALEGCCGRPVRQLRSSWAFSAHENIRSDEGWQDEVGCPDVVSWHAFTIIDVVCYLLPPWSSHSPSSSLSSSLSSSIHPSIRPSLPLCASLSAHHIPKTILPVSLLSSSDSHALHHEACNYRLLRTLYASRP